MDRRYRDPDFLEEQYVEQRKSTTEIAALCGVSSSAVSRYLNRHDVDRSPKYQNRDWLFEQYVERDREQADIANDCGVATTTICHWLGKFGITDGGAYETSVCDICGESFCYAPSLRDGLYCSTSCAHEPDKNKIEVNCAGCGDSFERWPSMDTEYCSLDCWSDNTCSDSAPSTLYAGVWYKRRQQAMQRDRFECTVCGISNQEHKDRFGRSLEVHHKVPVRLFDSWDCPIEDAHSLRNLITVCRTHHPDAPGSTVQE